MRNMIIRLFEEIFRIVCNQYEQYHDRFKNDTDFKVIERDFKRYITKNLSVGSIESTDTTLVTWGTLLGPMQVLTIYNPLVVMQSGAAIAVNAGSYATVHGLLTIVFVDGLFDRLSKDSQKFIIFHELGHSVRGKKKFRKLSEEIICDKFAKANLHNVSAVGALQEVKNVVASAKGNYILKRISTAEISKRISAVE